MIPIGLSMISKKEFIDLITEQKKWSKRIDDITDYLGLITLYECDWIEYTINLFNKTLEFNFNDTAIEDIQWWMTEKSENQELMMWDKDNNEIPVETVEDLWNIVEHNRK